MLATKNERFYIALHAGKKIVLRNIMRKRAGKTEPMIQVEILDNSKRLPMVRCDRTRQHGLHLDWFNKDGVKVLPHQRLRSQTPKEATVEVIDMLKEELEQFLTQHWYSDVLRELPGNWKSELENAKEFLLAQAEHPERIAGKSGTTALGFAVDMILSDRVSVKLTKGKKEE